MSWNYRVTKRLDAAWGEEWYEIREVYYGDDGEVQGWTARAASVSEASLEDMKVSLQRMLESLDKPVIEIGEDGE